MLNTNLHGIFPRNTMSQKEVGMRNSEIVSNAAGGRGEEWGGGAREIKNEKRELEMMKIANRSRNLSLVCLAYDFLSVICFFAAIHFLTAFPHVCLLAG